VAAGKKENFSLFGRDYYKPDGTCIHDYIHVNDLCKAHWLSPNSLINGSENHVYNLGNANVFSVQEIINVTELVIGRTIKILNCSRILGDHARLIASLELALHELGWKKKSSTLEKII
jgi:UDP-glucose 4-epimerase